MFENIGRKDIEFHQFRYNSEGKSIGAIIARPISIFFDRDRISDDEVRTIVDSHQYDISNCMCDDERMIVVTTPAADRAEHMARQNQISLTSALYGMKESLLAG